MQTYARIRQYDIGNLSLQHKKFKSAKRGWREIQKLMKISYVNQKLICINYKKDFYTSVEHEKLLESFY